MRKALFALLLLSAPAHAAGGRAAFFEHFAKTKAVVPVPGAALQMTVGAGIAAGLVIPRLTQSSLPGAILNMPAPQAIGGPLNLIPETPSFLPSVYELAHDNGPRFAPIPGGSNPAAPGNRKTAAPVEESLRDAVTSTLDPKEARKKSEILGDAAREMRREDGPSFGTVFDGTQRAHAAAEAIAALDHAVHLPSRRNYDGMISALSEQQTFRQDGLAQLQAMVKAALQRNDLQFLARFALLSMHDPRAHALAVGGIRKMAAKNTDLGSTARNTLESIEHYRNNPSQIPGRDTTIPRDLRAAADRYSR